MRALITGGYGFVGRHLAQYLVRCGDDVAVTYLAAERRGKTGPEKEQGRFETPLPPSVQSIALDVTDRASVNQIVSLLRPDVVYHLAGITFIPEAERDPQLAFNVNFQGTINLLEAIKEHTPEAKFLFVSSSEVYGEPRPGSLPLTELSQLRPVSMYAVSKAAADLATFKYAFTDNIGAVRVRPFPHIGPGQSDRFAIASFSRQLAEIKLGMRPPVISVGNLEAKRDYSDVSDIVRGYREAVLNGKRGGLYNLCSGVSISIGEILQRLIKVAEVEVEIQVDPERLRPADIPELVGSSQKAQKEFGWRPRIDFEGTLHSLFAFWMEALAKK